MKPTRKKSWKDALITVANEGHGKAEKKLRGVLRTIALFKAKGKVGMLPRRIEKDLEEMIQRLGLLWTETIRSRVEDRGKTKIIHEKGYPHLEVSLRITAEELPGLQHFLRGEESTEKSWRIYYNQYLLELFRRLQDPQWVKALKTCPGCGKLLLSDAKYPTKWCPDSRCRKRIWARKSRKKIECPADDLITTLLQCKQNQNWGGFRECKTCPNRKED